jgi:hypothetical protein
VTRRVQLKRTRCRENGFIDGKKRFQICFVATYRAATSSLGIIDRPKLRATGPQSRSRAEVGAQGPADADRGQRTGARVSKYQGDILAEGGFSFRSTTIRGAGDGSIGGGGRGAKKRPRCSRGPDSSLRLSSAEGPLPPSANTMRGARDGSVATKPANQGRAPRSKRRGQFSLNALAFGGRGVSRLRALARWARLASGQKERPGICAEPSSLNSEPVRASNSCGDCAGLGITGRL